MLLRCEGISRPVALLGCEELIESFSALLNGWSFAKAPGETTAQVDAAGVLPSPAITLRSTEDGYEIDSEWIPEPEKYDNETDIVAAFFANLIMARAAEDECLLWLHCAAVALSGKLLVFPSASEGGKSTLAAHLAQAGGKVFSDDVLPVNTTTKRGVALGIAPRLRLPLPKASSDRFLDFVGNRNSLRNEVFAYVKLEGQGEGGTLAGLGEEAPIEAFILLDRGTTDAPAIFPESKSELLKFVIEQHLETKLPATEVVKQLRRLVSAVPCMRLHYQEGEQAIVLLREVTTRLEKNED